MTTVTAMEVTLEVAAPPAEVFRYWTDPVRCVRWMGAVATLDARPGGRYELAMSDGFRAAAPQQPSLDYSTPSARSSRCPSSPLGR